MKVNTWFILYLINIYMSGILTVLLIINFNLFNLIFLILNLFGFYNVIAYVRGKR